MNTLGKGKRKIMKLIQFGYYVITGKAKASLTSLTPSSQLCLSWRNIFSRTLGRNGFIILLLDSMLAPSKEARIGPQGFMSGRALLQAWIREGGKDLRAGVGGVQQNGMGFGNKNLLGEKKGKNWCYSYRQALILVQCGKEFHTEYHKQLLSFCPEWRTERMNLALGLQDGCKVYSTREFSRLSS